jgi:hypothetical protein
MYNLDQMTENRKPDQSTEEPIAAVAYYGPDDQLATKAVVAIVDSQHTILESRDWNIDNADIRENQEISREISAFIAKRSVSRVVIAEKIVGCPHVPGTDYPAGEPCPFCPYWADQEE